MRARFTTAARTGGRYRSSIRLDHPVRGVDELWIETPVPQPESADPFLLLLAPLVLELGEPLLVDGPVSRSLLWQLDEFVGAMQALSPLRTWAPPTCRMTGSAPFLGASEVCDDEGVNNARGIAAATGGIDSTHTLLRHARLLPPGSRVEVEHLVFVHGFDIAIDDEPGYAGALRHVEAIAELLGIDVLPVSTNYRTMNPDWEIAHGAAVAAALHAVRQDAGTGLVASSAPYDDLVVPWGSAPYIDHLFSTRALTILHDGATANRAAKVAALATWPEVIPHLKFCWAGPDAATNCGECPKCILTGMLFDLCGAPLPPFAVAPTDALRVRSVAEMELGPFNLRQLRWVEALAGETMRDDRWCHAVRARLTPPPDVASAPTQSAHGWSLVRRARRRLAR